MLDDDQLQKWWLNYTKMKPLLVEGRNMYPTKFQTPLVIAFGEVENDVSKKLVWSSLFENTHRSKLIIICKRKKNKQD